MTISSWWCLNFTAQPMHPYRVGVPRRGRYLEVLNSDSRHYGGQNFGNIGRRHRPRTCPCTDSRTPWS